MDLSNDLISKFVKITSEQNNKKTKEGIAYGTIVEFENKMYVKLDGSDLLTPINSTSDVKDGERVTIMIKDHNAVVTGNITSPSASSGDVKKVTQEVTTLGGEIAEFETIVANKVGVDELDAEVARINNLIAGKAEIGELNATYAEIEKLKVKDAEIVNLVAGKAEIGELNAANANIKVLNTEVANIQTLVNGNLTSDNILSFNITAQNTTMENAFIKDAMIDSITANKIMSGVMDTNNVRVQSTDGSLLIQGTLIQMKDEDGKVRIQIGKDTGGNFTFILYDKSGTGVLIDEDGIKSSNAIADGLIVDAKVADNANIAGNKLDIASVITEVNKDNSTTIKSSKIYLNEQNQSLEVAFNSLKTQVETIQDVTIDGDLSSIVEQVQSNTTQIEANKEGISTLVGENTIRKEEIKNLDGEIESVNTTLSNKYSTLEQNVSGFKTTVANTYATKQSVTDVSNNLANNYTTTRNMNSTIEQTVNDLTIKFSESGGYNLLQNGHAYKGTSYWVNNGGGLNSHANAVGNATGNYFSTSFSDGIRYYEWIQLLPNTHYVYQAKIWSNTAFNGDKHVPLHYWFSSDGVNNNSTDYTILDYQQNIPTSDTWTQCYIHFVTGNSNIYFIPFIYNNCITTTIYVTELMLSQSRVVQPWSPHPNEVYSGITQIDEDGIKVKHSDFNGWTHMSPYGFYLNRNGEDLARLDSSGLYIKGRIDVTSGSISGTTSIDGNGLVTGSITADKLCIGDTNNYCQLTKGVTLTSRYGTARWVENDGNHCYWASESEYLPFTIDGTKNPFKEGDILLFDLDMYSQSYVGSREFRVYFYNDDNSSGYMAKCSKSAEILEGWNNYKFEVVINNSCVKSAKTIAILACLSGVYAEVRNVVIRRKVSGELIVDGSITAEKIAADAITGKTITGSTIKGGTISGTNISGTTFTSAGTEGNNNQYQTMILNSGALMMTGAIVGGTNDGQEANRSYLTSMGLIVKDSSYNGFGGNANVMYTNTGIYWNPKTTGGEEYPGWDQLIGYYDDYVLIDRLPLRMPAEIYTSGIATGYTNLYIAPTSNGEVRVVTDDSSSWGIGDKMIYRPIRASAFYRTDGKHAYINNTGGGTLTSASNALVANGVRTDASNFYIGVDDKVIVSNKNGYNDGKGITYKPITASAFQNSSDLMFKKNIRTIDDLDIIDILNKVDVYRYDVIGGDENEIGLIAQACPSDLISGTPYDMDIQTANEITDEDRQSLVDPDNGGASVNLYHMASILWKVCKEQQKRIERLEKSMKGEE